MSLKSGEGKKSLLPWRNLANRSMAGWEYPTAWQKHFRKLLVSGFSGRQVLSQHMLSSKSRISIFSTNFLARFPSVSSTTFSYVPQLYLLQAATKTWMEAIVPHALDKRRIPPHIRPASYNAYGKANIPAPKVAEHKFATAPGMCEWEFRLLEIEDETVEEEASEMVLFSKFGKWSFISSSTSSFSVDVVWTGLLVIVDVSGMVCSWCQALDTGDQTNSKVLLKNFASEHRSTLLYFLNIQNFLDCSQMNRR